MVEGRYKNYVCVWCQYEFKCFVSYLQGEIDPHFGKKGKKGSVSTQVKCPKCQNFNPTWRVVYVDGKKHRMDRR